MVCCAKTFLFTVFWLFIYLFISLARGDVLLRAKSGNLLPIFSFGSFMVSDLMFKSVIHFEFVFLHGVGQCSTCILCVCLPFSQLHWLKRLRFSLVYSWLFCHKLIDYIGMGLFLGSLFCSIDLCAWFYANIILFWLLQLCNTVWNQGVECL